MINRKVASLFAGIGGICLGFKQAGYEIIWANEINLASCKTYAHNFGSEYLAVGDIKNYNAIDLPDFDILTAGFPCQSFSIGGHQKGFEDNRGVMFFEVTRIVKAKNPNIVFLENVENLLNHDNGKTFFVIYNSLASLGYAVKYLVMPTNEYGNLPQARRRIYLLAFLDYGLCDRFCFPSKLPLATQIENIVIRSEEKNSVYYYKRDSQLWFKLNSYIGKSNNLFRMYKGQIRCTRYSHLCPTLTASMCNEHNAVVFRDNKGIRRLTLRECLDMQGFPNDFYFPNTISLENAYRQIGNSVSVPVVKRIAQKLSEAILSQTLQQEHGYGM